MPLIPILLSDSPRLVEYKVQLAGQVTEIQAELDKLRLWRSYYEGDHDVPLSDDQIAWLTEILGNDAPPIDNKCRVVVNKLRARLDVEGFLMPDEDASAVEGIQPDVATPSTAAEWAWYWWRKNRMDSGERELYKAALRDGWAYVIVGHNGTYPRLTLAERWDGTSGVRYFWDNERMHRDPLYAVRYWYTRDPSNPEASNIQRVTVYTSNRIYKCARPVGKQEQYLSIVGRADDDPTLVMVRDEGDEAWPLVWEDGQNNPLGIAVIPFVAPRGSLLQPVIGLQRRLNKTWYDLDVAADQLSYGVPVIEYPGSMPNTTGTGSTEVDPAGDGLGLRPGRVLEVGGGAKAHKLPADDLKPLLAMQRETVVSIAANSEQPIFNFIPLGGEVPSGAALDELNRPLAEQAEECQPTWSDSWRDVFILAQRLDRIYGNSYNGEPTEIVVRWKPQPRSADAMRNEEETRYAGVKVLSEALKALTSGGLSLPAALELVGIDPASDLFARLTRQDVIPPER